MQRFINITNLNCLLLLPGRSRDIAGVEVRLCQSAFSHVTSRQAVCILSPAFLAASHIVLTLSNTPVLPRASVEQQKRRIAALGKFRSHQTRILVSTDVCSRGLVSSKHVHSPSNSYGQDGGHVRHHQMANSMDSRISVVVFIVGLS